MNLRCLARIIIALILLALLAFGAAHVIESLHLAQPKMAQEG